MYKRPERTITHDMAVYVSSQRCISTALYQPTEISNLKYRVVFHLAMQTSILGLMDQLFCVGACKLCCLRSSSLMRIYHVVCRSPPPQQQQQPVSER